MTVKELIDLLYEFEPEAQILVSHEDGDEILACADVTEDVNHNCVIWP